MKKRKRKLKMDQIPQVKKKALESYIESLNINIKK